MRDKNKDRERFEALCDQRGWDKTCCEGANSHMYSTSTTECSWEGYQAAL